MRSFNTGPSSSLVNVPVMGANLPSLQQAPARADHSRSGKTDPVHLEAPAQRFGRRHHDRLGRFQRALPLGDGDDEILPVIGDPEPSLRLFHAQQGADGSNQLFGFDRLRQI
jgi:hypothetical protein